LLLTFIGAVLSASSALAAEPVPDTQELARQFILGKSVSAPPGSKSRRMTSAQTTADRFHS